MSPGANRKHSLAMVLGLALIVPALTDTAAGHSKSHWFRVDNVRPGSVLWIRSGPSRAFRKIGFLPHSARHVFSTGCKGFAGKRWCKVRYRGVNGWVAARYLAPDTRRRA